MEMLKPCPFCGNETAVLLFDANEMEFLQEGDSNWNAEPYFTVACSMNEGERVPKDNWTQGCGASSGYRKTKDEAVAAWNSRTE